MQLALKLAKKGVGKVSPNPQVGCVIVRNNKIIATGYHKHFGGSHAEIDALNNCKNPEGATMYVNLEPCCHYNKKTPPCVPEIIKLGIKKVVVAMKDPNPLVSGKGIKQLRVNNVKVEIGILEEEAEKLNETYIKYITKKIPFVILKLAFSIDGKTKTFTGDSKWISSESSRKIVHKLRSITDAILVGSNTVLVDNPSLTSHGIGKNPRRVVLDANLETPFNSNVLNNEAKTIIATSKQSDRKKKEKLSNLGVKILELPDNNGFIDLKKLLVELGKLEISSLIVEGGETVARAFLKARLVDKINFFICPKIINNEKYVKDAIIVKNVSVKKIENDLLYEGYLK
ncbi:MAG: riboflavin biosynthesis protein RibD [Elusimicrobia bacterium RIFOXYD2_FULL_34_15]|nr:MAG: riboflavin biosynthesis protein RibD [Elusimicrobia bacterium RIFOXYD2_FULL_34_15]